MIHRIALSVLAVMLLSTTAFSQDTKRMSREEQDAAFLADACNPTPVDTTLWPRHRISDVTIAVPPQYRLSQRIPNTLLFRHSYGAIRIARNVNSRYDVMGPRRYTSRPLAKETWCEPSNYGGYDGVAHAFIDQGRYNFSIKWQPFDGNDLSEWVSASFGTSRYEEAVRLRAAFATIRHLKDDPSMKALGGNPAGWFFNPCLGDSVDTWGWTRYDLRGVRIRAPREVRQVKVPDQDELHFRTGKGSLRLRLHNDASKMFAELNVPEQVFRRCDANLSGQAAEVFSYGKPGGPFGFTARWADAERKGEWLVATLSAPNIEDATLLRRVLFTVVFPK